MTAPEEEPEPLVIEFTADSGPFLADVRRAQSAATFASHPDLIDMDDEHDEDGGPRHG